MDFTFSIRLSTWSIRLLPAGLLGDGTPSGGDSDEAAGVPRSQSAPGVGQLQERLSGRADEVTE